MSQTETERCDETVYSMVHQRLQPCAAPLPCREHAGIPAPDQKAEDVRERTCHDCEGPYEPGHVSAICVDVVKRQRDTLRATVATLEAERDSARALLAAATDESRFVAAMERNEALTSQLREAQETYETCHANHMHAMTALERTEAERDALRSEVDRANADHRSLAESHSVIVRTLRSELDEARKERDDMAADARQQYDEKIAAQRQLAILKAQPCGFWCPARHIQSKLDKATDELDAWRGSAVAAAMEDCGDSRHCTCVGLLRAELSALREKVAGVDVERVGRALYEQGLLCHGNGCSVDCAPFHDQFPRLLALLRESLGSKGGV
jgi:hypothetical protein